MSQPCSLPDTQTQTQSIGPSRLSQDVNDKTPVAWGRLISCKMELTSLDLVTPVFTFGRSDSCSISVQERNFKSVKIISKVHFKIEKDPSDALVYLTDLSKNGTSLNKSEVIGRGKRRILKNDDQIYVGAASCPVLVYVFKNYKDINGFLPGCLQRKYEYLKVLGRGACGEVHLVIDTTTCELYAVKRILIGNSNSSQIHKINHPTKIHREITILKSLSHPGIIKMKDIMQTEREVYIILEYMAGGELTDRIVSVDRMSESAVKHLFYQAALAVQYLHSKGIVHRDLKPENILLTDSLTSPRVKLTDFGLSKDEDESLMETACGTLCYVAPEVINQNYRGHYGEYGKKCDVWSLGVILYYMLSQELPFKGKVRGILQKQIVTGRIYFDSPNWTGISASAKDLVKKMLVVQPFRRISVDEVIVHPWIQQDHAIVYEVNAMMEKYSESSDEEGPAKKFKFCGNIPQSDESSDSVTIGS